MQLPIFYFAIQNRLNSTINERYLHKYFKVHQESLLEYHVDKNKTLVLLQLVEQPAQLKLLETIG